MNLTYVCATCKTQYPVEASIWRCQCGGLLDLASFPVAFPANNIRSRAGTLWRYREALPFKPSYQGWQNISLGEGFTPLVPLNTKHPNAFLKIDYMMPTLSFKDRGAAVLVAKAHELGVTRMIADSSGNAGTAIAAYAARAGIACDVYVPSHASGKKIKQIAAHNARVHAIEGSREDVAAAAIADVEQGDAFYASHVYNPFFFEGTKTYAYEIWEQLEKAPDAVILPVGNGTMLLGTFYGFNQLLEAGKIESVPRIIAIQSKNCSPLAQAFRAEREDIKIVSTETTAAEGIAIAAPARSKQILSAVRETKGTILTVTEKEIQQSMDAVARMGFYVEPTAAVNYAGFLQYSQQQSADENIVIPLCGAGLKAL